MKLLVDTDAFCKLGVSGLLADAAKIFGASLADCGRLAALPFMLKRGRLRERFGPTESDVLLGLSDSLPVMAEASEIWLERMVAAERIDPGEAQIFAVGAELGMPILTGDKRAVAEIKAVEGLASALNGRVVTLEAMLIALCNTLGVAEVAQRVEVLRAHDVAVKTCFSSSGADPRDGLTSYQENFASEVLPLILWTPPKV